MAKRLKTGKTYKLNELAGTDIPIIVIGMGWDNWRKTTWLDKIRGKRREADLDLMAVVYDDHYERIDNVWYANLQSKDMAIKHLGDDTIGVGGGDDEMMTIDLYKLFPEVKKIYICTTAFSEGDNFSDIKNCFTRIMDGRDGREICRFSLQGSPNSDIKVMLELNRGETGWELRAVGRAGEGSAIQDVYPVIRKELYDNE